MPNDVKMACVSVATILGILCVFIAGITYASSKFGGQEGGGVSEGKMTGFLLAALVCFGVATYIGTQDLTVSFGG